MLHEGSVAVIHPWCCCPFCKLPLALVGCSNPNKCPSAEALCTQLMPRSGPLSLLTRWCVSAAHLGGDGRSKGSTERILIKLLLMSPSGLKFLLLVFHSVKCFANQSKGRDVKS